MSDACGPRMRLKCFLFRGTWRGVKLFETLRREFGLREVHAALDAGASYFGHRAVRTVNPEVGRQGFISVEQNSSRVNSPHHFAGGVVLIDPKWNKPASVHPGFDAGIRGA